MSTPLQRPRRKNPILRTRQPTLPPAARSRFALGLTAAAARGRLELQFCRDCGAVQYPAREACHRCLSDRFAWRPVDGAGAAHRRHAHPYQPGAVLPRARALAHGAGAARLRRHRGRACARGLRGGAGAGARREWPRPCRAGGADGAAGRRRDGDERRPAAARADLRPALSQGAGHRRQDRGRAGDRRSAGRGRRRHRLGRLFRAVEEISRLRPAEEHSPGDPDAARRHRFGLGARARRRDRVQAPTSSSIPRNIIAPTASPSVRASRSRAPRWT